MSNRLEKEVYLAIDVELWNMRRAEDPLVEDWLFANFPDGFK
jgi:hypothetical protein